MRGYVTVRVWGYSVERLLNLCGNHDILVWGIKDHGDFHTMQVSVAGFFALKPLLKKTGTRVKILRRYGLPFFAAGLFRRKVFVAGLLGCLIFLCLTTRFIWDIRIEGNFALTEDVLLDYLAGQGVHSAMKKSDLNIEALEQALREDHGLITWTSVQLRGCTLLIRIKENDMPVYDAAKKPAGSGMDLAARRDGVITYIVTRSGAPKVARGDSVKAGDILVSGAIPVYHEDLTVRKFQYVEADADITLRYSQTLSLEEPVSCEEKRYTGEALEIPVFGVGEQEFAFRLSGIPYERYDVNGEKRQVRLLERLYLPLYYGKRTVRAYQLEKKIRTEEEMKALLQARFGKMMQTLEEKGVQIAKKNVTIKKNEEKWTLQVWLWLEEAAVKRVPTPPAETAGER